MIDSKSLLADLQQQVALLEADLAEQLTALSGAESLLRAEYDDERKARRTAASWEDWRKAQLTQIAVAWMLGTVFLRWSEDNRLIDPVLSGPGDRLAIAEDAQLEHYRRHPEHNDADWLAEQFSVLQDTDAGRLLFDGDHNPLYWVPISHDAAKSLVAFWRSSDADGLVHDFTDPDWDTRFLGDLYQDLSAEARKNYALLQTPRFIERFILDRTLTPAIDEFGLDGLRLIDPACGSGHFLLGAFARIVAAWREQAPGLDAYEIVRRSLTSVHGVDMNPFAVAIARFRLLVAALREAGVTSFAAASGQSWRPVVACTDSLRTLERQESFAEVDEAVGHRARWEDVDSFADDRLLTSSSYHVVVGNPPYITVKDPEQNAYYRQRWSACHSQFQLGVPFAQRIFNLARSADSDGIGAGLTGQITSNAFMKRDFGEKLIEEFFPTVQLDYVVNTSGMVLPGHGTPTVILIGRRSEPRSRQSVRAVLAVRRDPPGLDDPETGPVWEAIKTQIDQPGTESEWISVRDLPREHFGSHPWSLSGGGAGDLIASLEEVAQTRLAERIELAGRTTHTGLDEAFYRPSRGRQRADRVLVVQGKGVRDYQINATMETIFPYDNSGKPNSLSRETMRELWLLRRSLSERVDFGQRPWERGLRWLDHSMFFAARYRVPLSIAFAFKVSHNHFVLDKGGKVFKQTAPAIKLPEGSSRDDHTALLGVLNSSTACFWLRENAQHQGGGAATNPWSWTFEFSSGIVERLPLPPSLPGEIGRQLEILAELLATVTPAAVATSGIPDWERLNAARQEYDRVRARLIFEQEELDWEVYRLFGLLSDAEAAAVTSPNRQGRSLCLGERAFEILLSRLGDGSQWFVEHGSTPISEIPAHWPDDYRRIVQARIDLISKRRDLALIERPECKRRWAAEPWEKQQERALRHWLLDRMEARHLWFSTDENGDQQPATQSVKSLADHLRDDEDLTDVARLWATDALDRPDADLADVVGALVDDEHVPFLPAYRYKPSGLDKRARWEHTWTLQRQEDAIASRLGFDDVTAKPVRDAIAKEIGEVPVPPTYGSGDFVKTSYWSQRGKLDVPKERFISYPAATRDGDGSLLLGWAGWDHREQAQALAILIGRRRVEDGWEADRLTPLLAGIHELLPWVHQWHPDIDPVFGSAPADVYDGFLDGTLAELHLSRRQLTGWRPEGRVDVRPLPTARRTPARSPGESTPRTRRPRSAPDPAHIQTVLTAAADTALSNEQIRELTGLDTTAARALAQHLITEGRLTTTGQRRGTRYHLAP